MIKTIAMTTPTAMPIFAPVLRPLLVDEVMEGMATSFC